MSSVPSQSRVAQKFLPPDGPPAANAYPVGRPASMSDFGKRAQVDVMRASQLRQGAQAAPRPFNFGDKGGRKSRKSRKTRKSKKRSTRRR